MNNPTATREELKAILDEWIPKYIRQVVELRSGSRLSAERYNELMNLLITQGDDTIELAQVVKQYVEILVDEMNTEFEVTTETVTNLANTAIATANGAASTVEEYKVAIDNDIAAFKAAITQAADTANSNADLALQTASQLVADMSDYRNELTQDINDTFEVIRADLGAQVTDEVLTQMQGIQEALTTDINTTISALSTEVLTIANTAEQTVNAAIQDIETYKTNMDVRLDAALEEVEDSLSAAGDIIRDASAIYTALDELTALVNSYDERIEALEEFAEGADEAYAPKVHSHSEFSGVGHSHTKEDITNFPTSMPPTAHTHTKSEISDFPTSMTPSAHTHTKSQITDFPTSMPPTAHTHTKSQITDFPTSLPASDVYAWAKANVKPTYTWNEITSKPTSFTPTAHNQTASTITAGTFGGQVSAPAGTDYTTNRIRNNVLTTTDPGAGVAVSYVNGSTIDVYE